MGAETGEAETSGAGAGDAEPGDAEPGDAAAIEVLAVAPGSFTAVDAVLAGAMSIEGMSDNATVPARPRRKRVLVFSAVAVVVAVLAAGGAYAVVRQRWDKPTGVLPEDRLLASVVAFARVNLTPGLGQRVKFEELLRRSGSQQFEDVKRGVFEGLEAPITYADVAPWFDDRIGVAMWAAPAHPDEAVTLIAVSTTNDKQARASLDAVQRRSGTDHVGFVVEDGYVLVAFATWSRRAPRRPRKRSGRRWRRTPGSGPRSRHSRAISPRSAGPTWRRRTSSARRRTRHTSAGSTPGRAGLGAGPSPVPSPGTSGPAALDLSGGAVVGVQAADGALEATVRLIGVGGLPRSVPKPGKRMS